MRVAVMSDIHGFSLGFDAVWADLQSSGPWDLVAVAGDLCEVGPDPRGVLDRLRSRPEMVVLKGNTDDDVVRAARDGQHGFAIDQIEPDGVAWLGQLPLNHRVPAPDAGPGDDASLLIVHANPHDLRGRLDPAASDDDLRRVLGDARFQTLAFGHVHICYQRDLDGRRLVDVSAVGNPKDGDLRSAWGAFTWDGSSRSWRSEIHRVTYPLAETLEQIAASGLPNPDKIARGLQRASY